MSPGMGETRAYASSAIDRVAAGSAQGMKSQAVPIGGGVPSLALTGVDGRSFDLADAHGRKIVLVFYRGHW